MISTGHHEFYTKFTITIDLLSLYYVISNHTDIGSIIVTAFKIRGFSSSYVFIGAYEIYTWFISWCFFRYFIRKFTHFYWPFSTLTRVTARDFLLNGFLMPGQHKCWKIIASVIYSHGWRRYVQYHLTTYFLSNCGMTILFLYVTSLIVFRPRRK